MISTLSDSETIDPYAAECKTILSCTNSKNYDVSFFVQAGELRYLDSAIDDVFVKILEDYIKSKNFPKFIEQLIEPIMYLLKRQQNLMHYIEHILMYWENHDGDDQLKLSQRMLFHIAMFNSSLALSRILMVSLSQQNVVPFIQPNIFYLESSGQDQKRYCFEPNIIHAWDYETPTLLSFGVGPCDGKSTLLNHLFKATFEQKNDKSIYFRETIDIDFGYNFITKRPFNIADMHGSLSYDLLSVVHPLFDGYLMHVSYSLLSTFADDIGKAINLLPNTKYCIFLIRDCPAGIKESEELDRQLDACLGKARSRKTLIIVPLPNLENRDNIRTKAIIQKLHSTIFHGINVIEKLVYVEKQQLEQLLDIDYVKSLNCAHKIILKIKDILFKASKENNVDNLLLYSKFHEYCTLKQEVARATFYGEDINKIFDIRSKAAFINDKYQFEIISSQLPNSNQNSMKLSKKYEDECGELFKLFVELLSTPNWLANLDVLSYELKSKRDISKDETNGASGLSIGKIMSTDALWRNAIVCQKYDNSANDRRLTEAYFEYIQAGFPFEIIDGDNVFFQYDFLLKVMHNFSQKKILIISVIGPQNSGKSTLLNYMFGTFFNVRNGRCTTGVYGSFVKSNIPSFDYIMLLDTEGLLGTEKGDLEYDRRLVLFCLAVSHLVIVNIAGDLNQAFKEMILLCVDSLKEIGVNKMSSPNIHFILNQRPDTNLANTKMVIKNIVEQLRIDESNKIVSISVEQFHALPSAFNVEHMFMNSQLPKQRLTSNVFLEETTKLTKSFTQSAIDICQSSTEPFKDPVKWIQNAYTVFDTLQRFPDLTHFKDVKEKQQDKQMKNDIRELLEANLSPNQKEKLLSHCLKKTRSQIDEIFQISFNETLIECENRLQTLMDKVGPSRIVRDRSTQFLRTQIYEARNSWREAAYRIHDQNELNLLVCTGEKDLRNLIDKTIQETSEKSERLTEGQARKIFDDMYNRKIESIREEFNAEKRLQDAVSAIWIFYDMYEKDCVPAGHSIMDYLQTIQKISCNCLHVVNHGSKHSETPFHSQKYVPMSIPDAIAVVKKEFNSFKVRTSIIEKQNFNPNLNVPYTIDTINKTIYLNKDYLRNIYSQVFTGNGNSDHRSPSKKSSSNTVRTIKKFFIPVPSTYKIIDQNLTNYRSIIYDRIMTDPDGVLNISVCFEVLFKTFTNDIVVKASSTEQDHHFHPIDIHLVQKIVASINSLILQINNELMWFDFVLSKQMKSRFHTCIIILLIKLYYHEQKTHFEALLDKLEENRVPMLHKPIQNHRLTAVNRLVNWAFNRSGYRIRPRLTAVVFRNIFSFQIEQIFF